MSIATQIQSVRNAIITLENQLGIPKESVILLAVSKGHPISAIIAAWKAGQRDFGENYIQEALDKIQTFPYKPINWHFIGRIQSNKIKALAQAFDWVHTVTQTKQAHSLNEQRKVTCSPLNICIQVNISADPKKAGIAPQDVENLATAVVKYPALRLRGLMTILAQDLKAKEQKAAYEKMAQLHAHLKQKGFHLDTLSMGMSEDYLLAIEAGATMVRVGTKIFGPSKKKEETP